METQKINSLEDLYKRFPAVEIDKGTFKYIQIRVKNTATEESILFVRGTTRHEYHSEIFEEFESKFSNVVKVRGLKIADPKDSSQEVKLADVIEVDCPGGGRIKHSSIII